MTTNKANYKTTVRIGKEFNSKAIFRALAHMWILAIMFALATVANAQTTNCGNPSLCPEAFFGASESSYLQTILNLPASSTRDVVLTVNSANALQHVQFNLSSSTSAGTFSGNVTQFNTGGFPPTGTSTLPRLAFTVPGTPSAIASNSLYAFYLAAGSLSATQLQGVQTIYAVDQVSRTNYATNTANLAKSLYALMTYPKNPFTGATRNLIQNQINIAVSNYNTLSNPSALAPNPRAFYGSVAQTLLSVYVNTPMSKFDTTEINNFLTVLNILAIGASNYDTNRIPVPNGSNTPTATTATFPLPTLDVTQLVATAQSNPASVFGSNVTSYLSLLGYKASTVLYQVNSANNLQFIFTPAFVVFFNSGFPVTTSTNAPQVAFNNVFGANGTTQYFNSAFNSSTTQQRLTTYYANTANATRRTNYGINLSNLTIQFQMLQASGPYTPTQLTAFSDAITALQNAQNVLAAGGLPDIFATYKQVNSDLNTIAATPFANSTQFALFRTLRTSLLTVGIENYYFTPIVLSLP